MATSWTLVDLDGATTDDIVIYQGSPGAMVPLYREGGVIVGGGSLAGFNWDVAFNELQGNGAGSFVFFGSANTTPNGDGVFRHSGAGLELLYRAGDPLVARTATVNITSSLTLGNAIAENGDWAFRSSVSTTQLPSAENAVIISSNGIVYQEGAAVPAVPGATVTGNFNGLAINSVGDVMYLADLIGAADTTNTEALFVNDQVVAVRGGAVPGLPGFTFVELDFEDLDINDARQMVFQADVSDGVNPSREGIFMATIAGTTTVRDLTCSSVPGSGSLTLNWSNTAVYDGINVYVNGVLTTTLAGTATMHSESGLPGGVSMVCLEPFIGVELAAQRCCGVENLTPSIQGLTCNQTPGSSMDVDLTWTNPTAYTEIQVTVNAGVPTVLAGTATSATIPTGGLVGDTVEICVVGVGALFGPAPEVCCSVLLAPIVPIATQTVCNLPGIVVDGSTATPDTQTDLLLFPTSMFVSDVLVSVDITTTFIGAIEPMTVTSPLGTTITLQNNVGGGADNLDVVYTDSGFAHGSQLFNLGLPMQPQGPGTMADFFCENAQGNWTLTMTDDSSFSYTLNEWCVGIVENTSGMCVSAVENIACSVAPGGEQALVSWDIPLGTVYSGYEITVNGVPVANPPAGSATSYTTDPLLLSGQTLELCVIGLVGANPAGAACCTVQVVIAPDVLLCNTYAPAVNVPNDDRVLDVINVAGPGATVRQVEVMVDISISAGASTAVLNPLTITSPLGTTVTLQRLFNTGLTNLLVTYSDGGRINDPPFDVNDIMQVDFLPLTPVMLDEFNCEPSAGDWTLTVNNVTDDDTVDLNQWCLLLHEETDVLANCCEAPSDLTCDSTFCADGNVTLAWTNNDTYGTLELVRDDGVSPVTIPLANNAVGFVDVALPTGSYTYTLNAVCANGLSRSLECEVDHELVAPSATCGTADLSSDVVLLNWVNNGQYDSLALLRDGVLVTPQPLPGDTAFTESGLADGTYLYTLTADCSGQSASVDCRVTVYTGPADVLLIPEVDTDTVGMYSPVDGTYFGNLIHDNESLLSSPIAAILGPDGLIYVSDNLTDAIRRYTTGGLFVDTFVPLQQPPDGLDGVLGIEFRNDHLFVASTGDLGINRKKINEYDLNGNLIGRFMDAGSPATYDPRDFMFLGDGTVLVADEQPTVNLTDRVLLFDANGLNPLPIITGLTQPEQLAALSNGNFLVCGSFSDNIIEFDLAGNVINNFALGEAVNGVHELDNGLWIYSNGDFASEGVYTFDPATQTETLIVGGFEPSQIERVTLVSDPEFLRGDANQDLSINIADAIFVLSTLFPPPACVPDTDGIPDGPPECPFLVCADAGDCNDDGTVNIADAVFLLSVLFPPPGCTPDVDGIPNGPPECPFFPQPRGACGVDPTADSLDCALPACP
ncbi:MAG: proprotein convertase P-domain-containing protein [Planctomycetota bacterium]